MNSATATVENLARAIEEETRCVARGLALLRQQSDALRRGDEDQLAPLTALVEGWIGELSRREEARLAAETAVRRIVSSSLEPPSGVDLARLRQDLVAELALLRTDAQRVQEATDRGKEFRLAWLKDSVTRQPTTYGPGACRIASPDGPSLMTRRA